ncbi:MAG: ester cyclase family protein [Polyangiaceae bacterium]
MNAILRGAAMAMMMATGLFAAGCDGGGETSGTGGTGGTTATTTSSTSDTTTTTSDTTPACDPAALQANKDLALSVSLDVFLKNQPSENILSSDFVAHFPAGQPDQDLNGFLGFGGAFRAALPDAAFTFTHVVADGDLVGLRYIGTGTHQGELFGIPATGNALRWEGMVIRRIQGGLVVEEWNAPDNVGLIGQLKGTTPKLDPNSADHTGAGDCTPSVIQANEDVALSVSKEVVLKGAAPDMYLSSDFVAHFPAGQPDQDLQGFLGFNAGLRAAFPDAAFTFTHTIGEGGLVTIRYTATGTHSADFLGIPATGKKIAWEGVVIRRIAAGKAAEEWNAPDIAGILGQLTAM